MIDFETKFNSLEVRKPQIGAVCSVPISAAPGRTQFKDNVEWLCANLKNTIFISSPTNEGGYDLIPLSSRDLTAGFPMGILSGWNDNSLRKGYWPTTPNRYPEILEVVNKWVSAPREVVYRVINSCDVNNIGFVDMEFSLEKSGLQAWISYGNINPFQQKRGHMTNATAVLISGIKEETQYLGCPLATIVTSVSDRNIGSQKILRSNKFVFDQTKWTGEESQIAMGGTSIPVVLNL